MSEKILLVDDEKDFLDVMSERIEARGDAVLFVGSERGLETRLVPEAGIDFVALPAQQIMGRGVAARVAAVPAIARACVAAWKQLAVFRADIVISVGGYASVPAVVAAFLRRIPVALVEPNAVPGRANRAAARVARHIFVQFDAAAEIFAGLTDRDRVHTLGIPLRLRLVEKFEGRPPRRLPGPPFRLLVFGGSQGARQINEAMTNAAPALREARVTVFHQTGAADRDRVAAAYADAGVEATVVEFERNMPDRYHWADLAVCRSGALTVAELALAGLPAIFVPYPYAADDHQAMNARALADAGAARVLESRSLTPDVLVATLRELLAEPERLRAMGVATAKFGRPRAADEIIRCCAAVLAGSERR